MKIIITYSSKTGNTEIVAKEVRREAEACLKQNQEISSEQQPSITFCRVEDAPDPEDFDAVIVGFWIDRGLPDRKAQDYIKTIHDKKVAFFCTLGALPDSEHADKCLKRIKELFQSQGNTLVGEFICQGKIDKKLIEAFKHFPTDHPMFYNKENQELYASAENHPDAEDLTRAREIFKGVFQDLYCSPIKS